MRSKSAINYERSRHIRQYRWMIHPFSDFRAYYEIFMMCIFITTLFTLPIATLFDSHPTDKPSNFLSVVLHIILIIDVVSLLCVLINFRTGHLAEDSGEVYLSPGIAAKHYLRGCFFIDVITAIPLLHFSFSTDLATNNNIVDMLSIVRLLRIIPLRKFYENTVEVYGVEFVKSRWNRVSFLTILFLHWSAYIHYLTAKVVQTTNCEDISDESWIKMKCQENITTIPPLYLESLFRSFANTFGVGYTHMWPKTTEDMQVTMLICICGNCLVFYAIVSIMLLINTKHASTTKYLKLTLQLRGYMQHKNLTAAMKGRIMSYCDYRFLRRYYMEEEILSSITSQLRQEITLHSCRRLVENVSFFQNIPMAMMIRIVSHMRSEWYLPNDVIITEGCIGNSMYFIKSGTVAIYTGNGKEVCHLEDGAHFGEISLVMPEDRRIASVVAVENCLLYRLDKEDFRRAVAPFPDLFARIQSIAKERLNRTEEISKTKSVTRVRMKLKLGPPQKFDNRHNNFHTMAL